MPFYDFTCSNCGYKENDVWIAKSKDRKSHKCLKCNEIMEVQLNQPIPFHLKGTGWYVTDYKNTPKKGDKGKK